MVVGRPTRRSVPTGIWDDATQVPLRAWGPRMDFPGSVADAAIAETAARATLAEHLALLAPGAAQGDFELAGNQELGGLRAVGFRQLHDGMPVIGGQVSFAFKNDRLFVIGSEALPEVSLPSAGARVAGAGVDATRGALAWIQGTHDPAARVIGQRGPFILPLVRVAGARGANGPAVAYARVLAVRVESVAPFGSWDVYVDAATGKPLARASRLREATGTLRYNAPLRHAGAERADYPAADAAVEVDGLAATCDADGAVSWSGAEGALIATHLDSAYVTIVNDGGAPATASLPIDDGGIAIWSDPTELVDAQIATFIHHREAKEYVRRLNPELAWLDEQLAATVNIADGACNAASDGDNRMFFVRASAEWANTGQLADVVYHETGHSAHGRSIIPGELARAGTRWNVEHADCADSLASRRE